MIDAKGKLIELEKSIGTIDFDERWKEYYYLLGLKAIGNSEELLKKYEELKDDEFIKKYIEGILDREYL